MAVSKNFILSKLPAFRNERELVTDDQRVRDIIEAILEAHVENAWLYDKIGKYFIGADIEETCDNLFAFCKDNLQYKEEPDDLQTVQVPQALLSYGHCDCKGYASFINGCLDAIRRETGKPVPWKYCFASYEILRRTPYHVFATVDTKPQPIWIDPTPDANNMQPVWLQYKRVNTGNMALEKVIGKVSHSSGNLHASSSPLRSVQMRKAANALRKVGGATLQNGPSVTQTLFPASTLPDNDPSYNVADIPKPQWIKGVSNGVVLGAGTTLAAIYMLTHQNNRSVGRKKRSGGGKKKSLMPYLLIGGGAIALYLYSKKKAETTTVVVVPGSPSDDTTTNTTSQTYTDGKPNIMTAPVVTMGNDQQVQDADKSFYQYWNYSIDRMSTDERKSMFQYIFGYLKNGLRLYGYPGYWPDGFYDKVLYDKIAAIKTKYNLLLLT